YGFHFIVKSLGTETAKSSIEKISFYPFPMTTLKNLRLVNPDAVSFQNGFSQKTSLNFEKTGNFLYKTNIKSSDSYLVLSQAYDDGWKAYKTNFQFSIFNFQLADIFPFIFGSEIKDHVLVNNWENGWKIDNYTLDANRYTLVIIFWPQYLEFAGFGILVLSVIFILFSKQSKNLQ
ncbi:MAG: hypothetical protein Q8P10_02555, partial [bacterium]|nr:hypothetical protein [bacterium]